MYTDLWRRNSYAIPISANYPQNSAKRNINDLSICAHFGKQVFFTCNISLLKNALVENVHLIVNAGISPIKSPTNV